MKTLIMAVMLLNSNPANKSEYINDCEDHIEWLSWDKENKTLPSPLRSLVINRLNIKINKLWIK